MLKLDKLLLGVSKSVRNIEFEEICKMSQKGLKKYLNKQLLKLGYEQIVNEDGFLYAKGNHPVCLIAHMDTVHSKQVENIAYTESDKGKLIISSPQGIGGDDRCGIYMILKIARFTKCSILFCEDEEIGTIGATKFVKGYGKLCDEISKDCNYLVEFDRANEKDAVFYDCDNPEFTKFITKSGWFKESWGSFSDISVVAPSTGLAAVNFSCGYYKAHTTTEYVVLEEMEKNIEKAMEIINTPVETAFEYIECKYNKYSYGYGSKNIYDYDEYYDRHYSYENKDYKNSRTTTPANSKFEDTYVIEFLNEYSEYCVVEVNATSEPEAVGIIMSELIYMTYQDILSITTLSELEATVK